MLELRWRVVFGSNARGGGEEDGWGNELRKLEGELFRERWDEVDVDGWWKREEAWEEVAEGVAGGRGGDDEGKDAAGGGGEGEGGKYCFGRDMTTKPALGEWDSLAEWGPLVVLTDDGGVGLAVRLEPPHGLSAGDSSWSPSSGSHAGPPASTAREPEPDDRDSPPINGAVRGEGEARARGRRSLGLRVRARELGSALGGGLGGVSVRWGTARQEGDGRGREKTKAKRCGKRRRRGQESQDVETLGQSDRLWGQSVRSRAHLRRGHRSTSESLSLPLLPPSLSPQKTPPLSHR